MATHNGKLTRAEYPDFDKLPKWQQDLVDKAIAKRIFRDKRDEKKKGK